MSSFKSKWERTPKPIRITVFVILGVLGVAAMGIIFGYGIKLLWNWLMPELFNLGKITYWQGIGIFVLAKLIFGFGFNSSDNNSKSKKDKKGKRTEEEDANWTDYEDWWETEGKKSFEEYAKEKERPDSGSV